MSTTRIVITCVFTYFVGLTGAAAFLWAITTEWLDDVERHWIAIFWPVWVPFIIPIWIGRSRVVKSKVPKARIDK